MQEHYRKCVEEMRRRSGLLESLKTQKARLEKRFGEEQEAFREESEGRNLKTRTSTGTRNSGSGTGRKKTGG